LKAVRAANVDTLSGVRTMLGALALSLLVSGRAEAQGNYRAVPLGGRSALMGNTGVVRARDGAAPFLNPATTVWIRDDSVAFSLNLYSVEYAVIRNYHDPGRVDRARFGDLAFDDATFTALRFDALPSTFCAFLNVGANRKPKEDDKPADRVPHKLAACVGTSERRRFEGVALQAQGKSDLAPVTRASTFRRDFGRVHVGPSYAATAGDRFTVGAALHVVSTSSTTLFSADSTTITPGGAIESGYGNTTDAQSFDVAALLGATYALDRATTFGLAFSPPTVHVAGTTRATLRTQHSADGRFSETRVGNGSFSAPIPMHVAAGMAVVLPRVKVELNAAYYFANSAAFASSLDTSRIAVRNGVAAADRVHVDTVEAADPVIDTAVGLDVSVGRELSVLLGFSEDFNASPSVGRDFAFGAIETARENRAMTSFGLASASGGSELLVGVQLSTTWGRTAAVNSYVLPNEPAFASERTYGALLIVAGSTSLLSIRGAVERLKTPSH
jgi:hypothetical protein